MTRAAIYTRVSSQQQEDDGTSLDTQLAACRAYCAGHGWGIVAEFTDTFTGTKYRERPGLSRLRELVRARGVDVVLVYETSRLSRNQAHMYIVAEEIEDHGARLEFVTEDFQDSAVGRFIRSAKSFADEVENEKRTERSIRGRTERVARGKPLPGWKARYGYRWADAERTTLEIEPAEAVIVRRIFAESAGGASLSRIVAGLAGDGIPSPSGLERWNRPTVRALLLEPTYIGQPRAFGRSRERNPVALPDGVAPALIDAATFAAAARRMERNKRELVNVNAEPERSLLRAGFIRCALCGRPMTVRNRSTRMDGRYECHHGAHPVLSLSRTRIDATVVERVRWLLEHEDALVHAPANGGLDVPSDDLRLIERLIAAAERERGNLIAAIAGSANADAVTALTARLDGVSTRLRDLENERAMVQREIERAERSHDMLNSFAVWREKAAVIFEHGDYEARREMLDAMRVQVLVWPSGHAPRSRISSELLPSLLLDTAGSGCGAGRR